MVFRRLKELARSAWSRGASERRFKAVFEQAAAGILVLRPDGAIKHVNERYCQLVGYDADEIRAMDDLIGTVTHPDDLDVSWEYAHALAAGEISSFELEVRYIHKDGSLVWVNIRGSALRDRAGRVQELVGIFDDITDRRRAEAALRVRARQQAAVASFGHRALSGVPLGDLFDESVQIIAQTLEVEPTNLLRLLPNERELQLDAGTGWADGVVGHSRVAASRDSQSGYTLMSDHPVVVEDWSTETRFDTHAVLQGAGVVSSASVVILGEEGRRWGVLGAHSRERRDFSADDVNFLQAMANSLAAAIARSRTEERLRDFNRTLETRVADRTAELEQRAAQLQALTSELTQTEQRERRRLAQALHDHLQQLLVAGKLQIGSALDAASESAVAQPLERARGLLDQAIQESRSLTVELSPPILYEHGLTAGLDWLARWMQEQHGLGVEVSASEDADPVGDDLRVLLFQAARELLFNVIKHAGVDRAEATLRRDHARRIELYVCDRGAGLARGSSEGPGGDGDGGFGLLSIRERLARFGGEFDLWPRDGGGTCARVAVADPVSEPARRAAQSEAPEVAHAHAEVGAGPRVGAAASESDRIRVVLADDHDIMREGLLGMLRAEPDIEVVGEARDGQSAVELTRERHPEVVVLDVTMPRMNGVEAARMIKDECPDIRVVGLSVHKAADMARAMRSAGATEYLEKDASCSYLLAAIRRCRLDCA